MFRIFIYAVIITTLFSCKLLKEKDIPTVYLPSDLKPIRNLELLISTNDTVTKDNVTIECAFINNTKNDYFIIGNTVFDHEFHHTCWSYDIYDLSDDDRFILPRNILSGDFEYPDSSSYDSLKCCGGEYKTKFQVDFRKLVKYKPVSPVDENSLSHEKNDNLEKCSYGKYAIKIYYWDPTLEHDKTLRSFYGSNELEIFYSP